MIEPRWEHFRHQADIGVRGIGATREEAFQQAAIALTAVIADPGCIVAREPFEVACEAPDDEQPSSLAQPRHHEMATRRMLFSRFDVCVDPVPAGAHLQSCSTRRHQPAIEVKVATYHELAVRRADGS